MARSGEVASPGGRHVLAQLVAEREMSLWRKQSGDGGQGTFEVGKEIQQMHADDEIDRGRRGQVREFADHQPQSSSPDRVPVAPCGVPGERVGRVDAGDVRVRERGQQRLEPDPGPATQFDHLRRRGYAVPELVDQPAVESTVLAGHEPADDVTDRAGGAAELAGDDSHVSAPVTGWLWHWIRSTGDRLVRPSLDRGISRCR
nr:hypothetical protein [Amycolatopsis antarctica]